MRFSRITYFLFWTACCFGTFFSCKKTDSVTDATIVRQWTIDLACKFDLPPSVLPDTGTATFTLWSDNNLDYTINISFIGSGEVPTTVDLYSGNILKLNNLLFNLVNNTTVPFINNTATGRVLLTDPVLINDLTKHIGVYAVIVRSANLPDGYMRGQMNNYRYDYIIGFDLKLQFPNGTLIPSNVNLCTGSDKRFYFRVHYNDPNFAGDPPGKCYILKSKFPLDSANTPIFLNLTKDIGFDSLRTLEGSIAYTDALTEELRDSSNKFHLAVHSAIVPDSVISILRIRD